MGWFKIKINPTDKAMSLLVRELADWKCERCGRQFSPPTAILQNSHFISRGNLSTRYDLENTAALCVSCHRHFSQFENQKEHKRFFVRKLGRKRFKKLMERKNFFFKASGQDESSICLGFKYALKELLNKKIIGVKQ